MRRRPRPRKGHNKEETPCLLELSDDAVGRMNITTRTASTRLGSRAKARAEEGEAKDNVTIVDKLGTSLESALPLTRAKSRARGSKENASTAER